MSDGPELINDLPPIVIEHASIAANLMLGVVIFLFANNIH